MAKNGTDLGFEQKLWAAADKLRNNMDAAEYKHVVLGLIFLKYISDSFKSLHEKLSNDPEGLADPEDKDEYKAEKVFWVPKEARWEFIKERAKLPEIGKFLDDAMDLIEKENPSLKGVLPKDYSRASLDKRRLGELVDLISSIGLGDDISKEKDILGRVYEYFLGEFADAEGKKGGQFYTPTCIVKILVAMLEPYKGRVYDPCCGSSGMFVQSEKFIQEHQGRIDDISIYGQESNPTTWKLSRMNLAIRGIEGNIALGDTFHNDQHKDLRADYIIANPPFNISDWGAEHLEDDVRWKFGNPPNGNANYAWVQHMIHHLAPNGIAGFVLATGSLTTNTSGEGVIRKKIVDAGLVDAIVALPERLFYNTGIGACLWFLRKDKSTPYDRKNEVLFIDARKMGTMVTRKNRDLSDEEIQTIADTYHNWKTGNNYEDILGFCKSATIDEISNSKNDYILTPGTYVGMEAEEDDGIPFEVKMKELTIKLHKQMEKEVELDAEIKNNLEVLGFK